MFLGNRFRHSRTNPIREHRSLAPSGSAVKDFLLRKTLACHCFGVFRRSSAFAPEVEHPPRTACPKTAKQWHVRIAFPLFLEEKSFTALPFRARSRRGMSTQGSASWQEPLHSAAGLACYCLSGKKNVADVACRSRTVRRWSSAVGRRSLRRSTSVPVFHVRKISSLDGHQLIAIMSYSAISGGVKCIFTSIRTATDRSFVR